MIECVLCDDILSEQMPGSLLAAAALLLALKFTRQFDQPQIVKRFYKHQPYKCEELDKCTRKIMKLMQQIPRSLYHTNVREKYKRSEFDRVAIYQYTNELGKSFI
jgi:predicted HTH transcriptional regulator